MGGASGPADKRRLDLRLGSARIAEIPEREGLKPTGAGAVILSSILGHWSLSQGGGLWRLQKSAKRPSLANMIKAIFYSKFDTQEGPKVVHQVPDGAIVPSSTAPAQPLFFTFSDISFFVIPRQELCGNLLQVCTNGYRILGYPICMKSVRYDRNEFIFNFCIVLGEEDDFSQYKSVVQKLADLMHALEEQNSFLSRSSSESKVYSLCEMLMEDLNNYCECMLPIGMDRTFPFPPADWPGSKYCLADDLNTLNIKLFPIYPSPPPVKAWYVPLFTVRYQAFMDENWDLTLQRVCLAINAIFNRIVLTNIQIVPHINGVNSIRIISILADTDFSLTCRAIRHLLYYGCLFLLDIFSFSAIYAPTASFGSTIATDEAMQLECARYVNTRFAPHSTIAPQSALPPSQPSPAAAPPAPAQARSPPPRPNGHLLPRRLALRRRRNLAPPRHHRRRRTIHALPGGTPTTASHLDAHQGNPTGAQHYPPVVDGVGLVELYAGLRQGVSVKRWYSAHSRALANIDIRRFITFGVIKGFLYRVHKYAISTGLPAPAPRGSALAPGLYTGTGPSSRNTTGTNTPYASSVGEEAPIAAVGGERVVGSGRRRFIVRVGVLGGAGSVPSGLEGGRRRGG
ncbi:Nitrogen permease regulator [Penicillium chermesinum]|nr:Nitrogen permease regulator [Penicillium chermesinum]